jgi:hypothetical protein
VLDPVLIAIEVETGIGRTLPHRQACDRRHRAGRPCARVNLPWSSTTCRPRGWPERAMGGMVCPRGGTRKPGAG